MAKKLQPKLRQVQSDMDKLIERDLPRIVKREGLQFISDNFAKEGFQKGASTDKWKKRKPPKSRKEQRRQGRNILVDRGHLRRSWDQDSKSKPGKVIFESNLPYAEVHNEGGKAGRGSGFTMPQRQMIGPSKKLDDMINKKVDKIMDKILNK